MKFAQIIEFNPAGSTSSTPTSTPWMAKSDGHRIPHRAELRKDRDAEDLHLLMVEISTYGKP